MMSVSGVQSSGNIQSQWLLQQQQVSQQQQQGAQTSKPADGDGDHGVEPGKGQKINLLG